MGQALRIVQHTCLDKLYADPTGGFVMALFETGIYDRRRLAFREHYRNEAMAPMHDSP